MLPRGHERVTFGDPVTFSLAANMTVCVLSFGWIALKFSRNTDIPSADTVNQNDPLNH